MPSQPKLRITWVKSIIGTPARQRATVRALGLHRLHQSVFHEDTPSMRGMIHAIRHLVVAQPATDDEVSAAQTAVARAPSFTVRSGPPAEAPVKRERRAPAAKAKHAQAPRHVTATTQPEPAVAAAPAATAEAPAAEAPAAAAKAAPKRATAARRAPATAKAATSKAAPAKAKAAAKKADATSTPAKPRASRSTASAAEGEKPKRTRTKKAETK